MAMRKQHNGILTTGLKMPINDRHALAVAYTPGVAEPCLHIKEDEDLSFSLTLRGNVIAVISDGTRVLGLGDIGAAAAIPVMEGKAAIYKRFANIDALPVVINTKDPEEFIRTVKLLEKNYAGINLEDISSPKCYDIEDRLIEEMEIPVFHDDQHGTAIAALAALLGALRFVKKDISKVKIVINGAGAAGTAIANMILAAGATDMTMLNSKGILHDNGKLNRVQKDLVDRINPENRQGTFQDAIKGADVLLGVSKAGAFKPEDMKLLAKDSIVFAMANPVPEIMYEDAIAAGVAVCGTGRSDMPNQVNNSSVFPGLFRGAIDVHSRRINMEMKLAAAYALADLVDDKDLRQDNVVIDVFDERVPLAVAKAVAKKAIETGVARMKELPAQYRD
nr:malic enzyme-like NAD(P)-binding protein [Negativicoccus succinicivorans]